MENFEQKYNKLIEAIKILQEANPSDEGIQNWVHDNVPELVESEDERIKREILGLVSISGNGNQFEEIKDWLEKQGDQKPDDKVKPKFEVGDWVIFNGTVAQILDKQKYGFVGLDIDGKDFFCNYGHTDSMRLWTIQDAKDGDVLMTTKTRNCPFIYRKTDYNNHLAYYYAGVDGNGDFCEGCLKRKMYHFGPVANITPATKEQRDLLFRKMEEAGYGWDSEKKKPLKL